MKILLVTHAIIWFINADIQLPQKSIQIIKEIKIKCYINIASIWEIVIKISLVKLDIYGGIDEISKIIKRFEIELLPINFEHIQKLFKLTFHHKDPFDRIIISLSLTEHLTIISKDENFRNMMFIYFGNKKI
jgi:PIN domain nuclease of toxin-antitoxin system